MNDDKVFQLRPQLKFKSCSPFYMLKSVQEQKFCSEYSKFLVLEDKTADSKCMHIRTLYNVHCTCIHTCILSMQMQNCSTFFIQQFVFQFVFSTIPQIFVITLTHILIFFSAPIENGTEETENGKKFKKVYVQISFSA